MDVFEGYNSAARQISKKLRKYLEALDEEIKNGTNEIRLRAGRPLSLCGTYGTLFLDENGGVSHSCEGCVISAPEDIRDTFDRLCSYSVHSFQKCINCGYIPMENGNRAGVCGTAVSENGAINAVKDITSINIRLSREVRGCADEILRRFDVKNDSIIIAGPPASGKTTIIRDIVRQISSGKGGVYIKTAVVDERREISGIMNGAILNDVGITSDILDSYPKKDAIDIAVRTLSPEVIVCDELSSDSEIEAVKIGINSGVRFIVTVHAGSEEEIYSRRQIEELLSTFSFRKLFLLSGGKNTGKIINEFEAGEILNEISLRRIGISQLSGGGGV